MKTKQQTIFFEERTIRVNELTYAFKHWRNRDWENTPVTPMLALHGWLDNANSFDVLIPQLLSQLPLEIVALDLAGHGLTEHRHIQGHYNIWNDLADIALFIDELGWQSCVLLGHSRGAMISSLFTTSLIKKVKSLLLLDGFLPMPIEAEEAAKQLARFVKQKIKPAGVLPSYKEKQDAIIARCKAAKMLQETARPIIERALYLNEQGRYSWRSDPRLNHPSAFKLSKAQNDVFLKRIGVPSLLLLASEGLANFTSACVTDLDANPLIQYYKINGSHHMHLEKEPSEEVTQLIVDFLQEKV